MHASSPVCVLAAGTGGPPAAATTVGGLLPPPPCMDQVGRTLGARLVPAGFQGLVPWGHTWCLAARKTA